MQRNQTAPTVNWLLHGHSDVASSRLQGYLVHEQLRRCGWRSRLVMAPPIVVRDVPWVAEEHHRLCRLMAGQIVVFQKVTGPNADSLVRSLREAGTVTVYVQSDFFPEHLTPRLCDVVVCPSKFLADFYAGQGVPRVVRIDDPAEYWTDRDSITGAAAASSTLRIGWIGARHNWHTLEPLRELLREPEFADVQLVTISDHPDADRPWCLAETPEILAGCDAGVVPVGTGPAALAKSANRIVQWMAAGRPVIAGAIPAYAELLREGENGFLCNSAEDWRRALRQLGDPARRRAVALSAYDTVSSQFRIETIARRWVEFFQNLQTGLPARRRGSVRSRCVEAVDWAVVRAQARLAYASAVAEKRRPAAALRQAVGALSLLPALVGRHLWRGRGRGADRLTAEDAGRNRPVAVQECNSHVA